ncbi:MAG: beta-ketoacyl synthase N-terminal-like domain-containing protein [Verrucomicrobia bacterium]|nr:beta-ketoacyl synthase N-terminal-like domain-containing protein [Verrucomicrobiota bacterium]
MIPKAPLTPITIAGWGAVSPAGWGVASLLDAVQSRAMVEPEVRQREGAARSVLVRPVPPPDAGERLRHPRLRRASPQVKFAAAACIEAMGDERSERAKAGGLRLGIVFATMCGAVQYSNRFYQEVLEEPATASPILFPETVFNATSSHLSAIFGSHAANYTLVGDSAEFLAALRIAEDWLRAGEVDGCLVVGSEELDWVSWEAMQLFDSHGVAGEGAGALYLELGESSENAIVLEAVTEPALWLNHGEKHLATQQARAQLPDKISTDAALALSTSGHVRADAAEVGAWADWSGPRVELGLLLGNCMGAGVALNAALACEYLASGMASEAIVSAAGHHHQCLAAWMRTA